MKQTPQELREHLQEQVYFLRSSGQAFDSGVQAEAKRLATAIRLLVYDTSRSRSLLDQLGKKDGLRYVDTSHGPQPAVGVRADFGLAVGQVGGFGPRYRAPLDERPRRTPQEFDAWWTDTVLTDKVGRGFGRRDLVLGLAHLDGGAHVDPELEEAYAALSRSNSLGWEFFDDAGSMILAESPVLANVRQVAHELQRTIEEQLAAILVVEQPGGLL